MFLNVKDFITASKACRGGELEHITVSRAGLVGGVGSYVVFGLLVQFESQCGVGAVVGNTFSFKYLTVLQGGFGYGVVANNTHCQVGRAAHNGQLGKDGG